MGRPKKITAEQQPNGKEVKLDTKNKSIEAKISNNLEEVNKSYPITISNANIALNRAINDCIKLFRKGKLNLAEKHIKRLYTIKRTIDNNYKLSENLPDIIENMNIDNWIDEVESIILSKF